jgi:hypothetical protein
VANPQAADTRLPNHGIHLQRYNNGAVKGWGQREVEGVVEESSIFRVEAVSVACGPLVNKGIT